jgi:Nucleotidyl transferase AbiEii toxin, Type IV TA system
MSELLDPRIDMLPAAQREIWPQLAPAPDLSFVLDGGTAIALHLGHRVSVDFDFFRSEPLEKHRIESVLSIHHQCKARSGRRKYAGI